MLVLFGTEPILISICLSICLYLLHSQKKIVSTNYRSIIAVTGGAHCQRQVAFFTFCLTFLAVNENLSRCISVPGHVKRNRTDTQTVGFLIPTV